jgi:hypothetical protein
MIDAPVAWFLNNAATIASLGLTATLVFLYYQQKEILRVERLPEIEISSRCLDGDDLEVVLSNYGHGLAKNVSYHTVVHAPDAEKFEPILVNTRTRRVNDDSDTTLEQSVRPHEAQVTFRGTPNMGYQREDKTHRFADFSSGFRHLNQADIDSVWFQIYIVVDDQLGGCQMKPLFWPARNPGDIDVSDDRIDLETAYDLGGRYDPEEIPNILTPDCRE